MRKILLALTSVMISVMITVIMLEIAMRFMPVHGGAFLEAVDEEAPYAHFIPNNDAQYSVGPAMVRAQPHRTNNAGFISPIDYVNDGTSMLAVVGDSYVEALMVPPDQAMQDVLRRALGSERRVYGFGVSGAATPQYLMWARHAVQDFGADEVVLVIVSTDFDEALLKYRARAGFHFLSGDLSSCSLELTRLDHAPNRLRPLVQHSALLRYLVFNLNLLQRPLFRDVIGLFSGRERPSDETTNTDDNNATSVNSVDKPEPAKSTIVEESKCAVDWVLSNAEQVIGLPKERIRFMVDGGRAEGMGVSSEVPSGYLDILRAHLIEQAREHGYPVVDLTPDFENAIKAGEGPFVPPGDSHWNAAAHALVAERYLREWGNSALSQ